MNRETKNGDKPINGGNWSFLKDMNDDQTNNGLTKREHFAVMAMQGLLMAAKSTIDRGYIIQHSVSYADALLAELAKETGE